MTLDNHARGLGGLLGNFHSLEFVLRVFLNRLPGARPMGVPHGTNIYLAPVGTELPENDMTSYDSLGQLFGKFNAEMARRGHAQLDMALVELRDALAHGRVSASVPDDTLRLIKFDKPTNGRVRVSFNELMTEEWFTAQKARVVAALKQVHSQVEA